MKNYMSRIIVIFVSTVSVFSYAIGQNLKGDKWLKKPVDDNIYQSYLEFFSYDTSQTFAETIISVEEREGIRIEHLSFKSTPDMYVTANLYSPVENEIKNRPALILLHGGTADGKDVPHYVVFSQQLVRAGWTVFSIDFLYFGERKSDLLTKFTEKDKHDNLYNKQPVYLDWIIQNVKDIGRAFDYLVNVRQVDKDRIGLFGLSRGAQVAVFAAAVIQKFKAVVLIYGGHFDRLETNHPGAACPANYISRIHPVPILMLNGLYDNDYNKETSVIPLFTLAQEPKKIIWTEGGHMSTTEKDRADVIKWMKKYIK